MIRKIIRIWNVGRFAACNAAGDVEFRNLTLVYAENGRGKTTLCDILHSLRTGNGDYVAARKTLGATDEPNIQIRLENDITTFQNGAWSSLYRELAIFDSTFVHENVCAGDYVDHEHKKNLYRVIVGQQGVALAQRVDELDEQLRNATRNVTEKKSAVERLVPQGVTLETFVGLVLEQA